MPIKQRDYDLTPNLLCDYRDAALVNAQALLTEAILLLAHQHHARAYFLSASSIEEMGKAVQAFEGLGRNLKDSAVAQRIKEMFENHSQKVTFAFSPWLQATLNLEKEVVDFVNTMIDLNYGREASMYTDINSDGATVVTPQMQVSEKVAANCIRLAGTVLFHVCAYVKQARPKAASPMQDSCFALKPAVFKKITNTADFCEYYLSRMVAGNTAFDEAVVEYNKLYFSKKKPFTADSTLCNS